MKSVDLARRVIRLANPSKSPCHSQRDFSAEFTVIWKEIFLELDKVIENTFLSFEESTGLIDIEPLKFKDDALARFKRSPMRWQHANYYLKLARALPAVAVSQPCCLSLISA